LEAQTIPSQPAVSALPLRPLRSTSLVAALRLRGSLRASSREGGLEAEVVEEGERAVAIAVGGGVHRGEQVLVAEEGEEGEVAGGVAVGAAGWGGGQRAAPAGDVLRLDAAGAVEEAADVETAGIGGGAILVEHAKSARSRARAEAGNPSSNGVPVGTVPSRHAVRR